jgi:hypothetical protein
VLLYLRAPGNMYCFYYDLDGSNDYSTQRLVLVEGIFLFSLIYSPLILVTRYLIDIGWFTYLALVLLSMAVYGIFSTEKFRTLTKWQHDHGCWFPNYFLRSGIVKFTIGSFFFVAQIAVSIFLNYLYISSYGKLGG